MNLDLSHQHESPLSAQGFSRRGLAVNTAHLTEHSQEDF